MKYIPADKLIAEVERLKPRLRKIRGEDVFVTTDSVYKKLDRIIDFASSLQQSKEAVELEMCAAYWWEEQGWIMIPPNVTLKGIESLLNQVKKKLQQEQSEQDLTEFEKALDDFGEAYATLVDRDNNPNQGIRINAYHELVQERINEILSLAKEYVKQEQPEVDLEKEIEKWFDENGDAWENGEWSTNDIRSTARHFYELGLNARKEEKK